MDLQYFKNIFLKNFGFQPTSDQNAAIDNLCRYVIESHDESVFLLTGYAGTGKTSLLSSFVRTLGSLNVKTVLAAPTGRAAKVFSAASERPAFTVHKLIYRQKSGIDGKFVIDKNLSSDTFYIIDEASMISQTGGENSVFGSGQIGRASCKERVSVVV